MQPDRIHFSIAEARDLAERAIAALGYDEEDRRIIADHVLDAALCGYEYSGLPKILNVADSPQAALPKAKPRIVHETAVSARMDGGNSVAMLAMARATQVAITKALAGGIALVSLGNSWTSGRSAHYLEMATRAGLLGMLTTSSSRKVAPFGGRQAALGTNPIAFGLPTTGDPLIFDMGTSAFMASELMFFRRLGRPLPQGVALDGGGHASTDPAAVLEGGALLPFGGHKGFGLALVIQALGLLDGSDREDDPNHSGYLLVLFQPDLLVPAAQYRSQVTALLQRVQATPRLDGVGEIRIPSQRAFRERERRSRLGIEIDRSIAQALERLAGGAGAVPRAAGAASARQAG